MSRLLVLITTFFAGAALAGIAFGATGHPTLRTAANSAVGKTIVVDGKGLTVYELRPETRSHLLCKKGNGCFGNWPPVTVRSRHSKVTAASGVSGRLGILHRNGIYQVTLGGHPLYHFVGDSSTKGEAAGDGLQGFGGTWHVVAAAASTTTTMTPTGTTTDTTTTEPPPYTYPPASSYTYPPPY